MTKRLRIVPSKAWLCAALAGMALYGLPAGRAQEGLALPLGEPNPSLSKELSGRIPEQPSLPPALTIPVKPLGFSAPGPFYLGRHNALASLDFFDENHLLFTFQVPLLMHRRESGSAGNEERPIKAVVIALPDGKVTAQAQWTLHDKLRYLWMLNDGHFLLRGEKSLEEGDATLSLKPYLHFPGRLLWLGMDPAQQLIETNVLVPQRTPKTAKGKAGEDRSAAAADAGTAADGKQPDLKRDLVMRISRLNTAEDDADQVVPEKRIDLTIPKPIDADGYMEAESAMLAGMFDRVQLPINGRGSLEVSQQDGLQWAFTLRRFSGDSNRLDSVESTCRPTAAFISEWEFMASGCDVWGGKDVIAMTTDGSRLWALRTSDHEIWPLVIPSANGLRVAREVVMLNRSVGKHRYRIKPEDVTGQLMRVFDATDGRIALEAAASPILDGGGNVAVSPSGRRVAVLYDGVIEVFDLPAPPAAPKHRFGR